ncbi:MAG: phosphoribosyltransferase family protein [Sphaerochaetaceae bacterium]|nr:phosphoribosyltransferase family protein [Sphaerochaetaceae bacterium]
MLKTFSLHKVTSDVEFPFAPQDYSKFKFGSKTISRDFGTALGEAFCDEVLPSLPDPIVVISSPYCFIPTATFAMKDYFIRVVNNWLAEHGRPVVEETRIHRTITYKDDYGELSAEERFNLIKNDSFHIDAEFVEDKTLILLDDIKITGGHERVVERTIQDFDLGNCNRIYTYFAELTNNTVNPVVENYLNYAAVKNLLDLDKIIKNDEFILNTRIVKFMLNSSYEEFFQFANYQCIKLLETIYHLAIGNSYHTMDDYKQNLGLIKELINNENYISEN